MTHQSTLAIFLSGRGSNFEAIATACENKELNAEIAVVFSNNPEASGLQKAKDRKIPTICIPHYAPREDFDKEVVSALSTFDFDWVVLCGYMRLLSPYFISVFDGQIINIHPSKLPQYPGTQSIEKAFKAGESSVGVTVHFVDQGMDTGPIILQDEVTVEQGDSLEQVREKVHMLEHKVYKKAIASLIAPKNESI